MIIGMRQTLTEVDVSEPLLAPEFLQASGLDPKVAGSVLES